MSDLPDDRDARLSGRFSFDLVLFGISMHQFITYLSSPGKDRLFVRVIVVSYLGRMQMYTSIYHAILTGSTGQCWCRPHKASTVCTLFGSSLSRTSGHIAISTNSTVSCQSDGRSVAERQKWLGTVHWLP